jgi:S1-C subfamily serine protease
MPQQGRSRSAIVVVAVAAAILATWNMPPAVFNVAVAQESEPEADSPPLEATATPTLMAFSDAEVASRIAPSVVQVIGKDGTGSGVKVAAGILTNEHVVHGSDRIEIISKDGVRVDAVVIRADDVYDLALLQTNLALAAVPLSSSRLEAQGAPLLVLGYPRADVLGGQATLTRGLLSALRDTSDGVTYVQTDAAMNPGNSGGAIANTHAELVGIAVGKLKDTEGINFGVAAESVEAFLNGPARPTAAPVYNTRKGPRTAYQIRQELAMGYGGPWDTDSMLAAYDRATATPPPMPNPLIARCQTMANAYPPFDASVQDAARANARSDYQALRSIAAAVRSRTYPNLLLPVVNAFLRVPDWQAAAAEIRFNWPLLTIAAAQSSSGYLIMTAAQADLNRADGEARAAALDLGAAARQLLQTCGR